MRWIITVLSLVLVCFTVLMYKWTREINLILTPVHVELRPDLYTVLREDTLNLDGMKIKRVYYLLKPVNKVRPGR